MTKRSRSRVGVDSFWEHADDTDSGEHPLERELADRLDAVARYRRLIAECEELGRDAEADQLLRQHQREQVEVDRLRAAIARMNERSDG